MSQIRKKKNVFVLKKKMKNRRIFFFKICYKYANVIKNFKKYIIWSILIDFQSFLSKSWDGKNTQFWHRFTKKAHFPGHFNLWTGGEGVHKI